ncbi:hypothetical protein Q7C36_010208 [Tachysurus vachellii]|uniref:Uncharacterized protein n=1 Tax=Tachysurus vachellii TaxID=175792 RepID=A0AA88MX95_TACVA|nr:hypothetical protein Q7C36_010208 [Tachysurus vachellii]
MGGDAFPFHRASASYGEKTRSRVNGSRCERERTPLFTASVVAEIGVRSVNVFVPRVDEDNVRVSELNPPEHAHSYVFAITERRSDNTVPTMSEND